MKNQIKNNLKNLKIHKIIIWGHEIHKTTHSYIHKGWFRTFKHLNIETLWLHNDSDIEGINFDNCLFFTEGNEDKNIPINYNSYYILHNCWELGGKYKKLIKEKRVMVIQKYENICKDNGYKIYNNKQFHYYKENNIILCLPWATDLLPYEIDKNINKFDLNKFEKKGMWVGSVWSDPNSFSISNIREVNGFGEQCIENKINYKREGGFHSNITVEENIKLISNTLYSPSVQMLWQAKHGYIPCRIFKNISYGGIPVTNNPEVYELLKNKPLLIENNDNIIEEINNYVNKNDNEYFKNIMRDVRDNHTYLNRINTYLNFLKNINNDNPDIGSIYNDSCCDPKTYHTCKCGRVNYCLKDIYDKYLKIALDNYYTSEVFKNAYGRIPKMRNFTFDYCFNFLNKRDNFNILELGTSRSFVDGKYPGCLKDDKKFWQPNQMYKWDWSAGCFTVYFSSLFYKMKSFNLTTVDINNKNLNRCKIMTEQYKENIKYICDKSQEVIINTPKKSVDLLYIDTGDMDEPTALLHKEEAILIVQHDILKDDGIILIDDVRNPHNEFTRKNLGKSKYSIPYFLNHGYEIIVDEYQVIMKKKA
jgi:hypothetical protein